MKDSERSKPAPKKKATAAPTKSSFSLKLLPESSPLRQGFNKYYHEVIYYMHQPQSWTIKYFFLACYTYGLIKVALWYQDEFRTVWMRKRARIFEIEQSANEPLSRQEFEIMEEYHRLTLMR